MRKEADDTVSTFTRRSKKTYAEFSVMIVILRA
jgi:hypothetical protein